MPPVVATHALWDDMVKRGLIFWNILRNAMEPHASAAVVAAALVSLKDKPIELSLLLAFNAGRHDVPRCPSCWGCYGINFGLNVGSGGAVNRRAPMMSRHISTHSSQMKHFLERAKR